MIASGRVPRMNRSFFIALVTAQTSEASSVAGSASCFVQIQLAGGVPVEEVGRVIGRLKIQVVRMTLDATERGIDFGVTDQAVFHVREIGLGECTLCRRHSTMTRSAGVVGNEVRTQLQDVDLVRGPEILLTVDGPGDDWRKVAQAKVHRMVEIFQYLPTMLVGEACRIPLLRMAN